MMSPNRLLPRLGLLAALSAVPSVASAAGGADISAFCVTMIYAFAPVWIIVAILVIVIAGFTLLTSSEDTALDKARKTITAVVMGGMIITIILAYGPLNAVNVLYNGVAGFGVINNASLLGAEAEGIAGWLTTMTAMAGVLMIVIAMVRAVATFGGDEASYTNVRMAVLHVIAGLAAIAAAYVLRQVLFQDGTPSVLLAFVADRTQLVLSFIATIAVAMLIYAGFRMVVSYGREEEYTAAKSLAVRVLLGLGVIAVSFTMVWAVVALFNGGPN